MLPTVSNLVSLKWTLRFQDNTPKSDPSTECLYAKSICPTNIFQIISCLVYRRIPAISFRENLIFASFKLTRYFIMAINKCETAICASGLLWMYKSVLRLLKAINYNGPDIVFIRRAPGRRHSAAKPHNTSLSLVPLCYNHEDAGNYEHPAKAAKQERGLSPDEMNIKYTHSHRETPSIILYGLSLEISIFRILSCLSILKGAKVKEQNFNDIR